MTRTKDNSPFEENEVKDFNLIRGKPIASDTKTPRIANSGKRIASRESSACGQSDP